jgi:hypothetical protein
MDRLTPEEFEELFNAYNSGITEDILSSPDRFDKLKSINKETAKAIANKRAKKLIQAGLTPNLDAFMPKSYTRWYRPFALDDFDTVKDTLSYANTLLDNENLPEDSLEDFSHFIVRFYNSKGINKKYSKDNLWKIYNYYKDSEIMPHKRRDYQGSYTNPINWDYENYSRKARQAGAVTPSFDTFIEDRVLGNPEANLDNKLNTLKQIQEGTYLRTTPDPVSTPPENIPKTTKDNEVTNTDTAPQVKAKSTEDIGDLYTYTMNRLSKDNKYRKLGWWK